MTGLLLALFDEPEVNVSEHLPLVSWLILLAIGLLIAFFVVRPELWSPAVVPAGRPAPGPLVRIVSGAVHEGLGDPDLLKYWSASARTRWPTTCSPTRACGSTTWPARPTAASWPCCGIPSTASSTGTTCSMPCGGSSRSSTFALTLRSSGPCTPRCW